VSRKFVGRTSILSCSHFFLRPPSKTKKNRGTLSFEFLSKNFLDRDIFLGNGDELRRQVQWHAVGWAVPEFVPEHAYARALHPVRQEKCMQLLGVASAQEPRAQRGLCRSRPPRARAIHFQEARRWASVPGTCYEAAASVAAAHPAPPVAAYRWAAARTAAAAPTPRRSAPPTPCRAAAALTAAATACSWAAAPTAASVAAAHPAPPVAACRRAAVRNCGCGSDPASICGSNSVPGCDCVACCCGGMLLGCGSNCDFDCGCTPCAPSMPPGCGSNCGCGSDPAPVCGSNSVPGCGSAAACSYPSYRRPSRPTRARRSPARGSRARHRPRAGWC
jgi:hypothetical protein